MKTWSVPGLGLAVLLAVSFAADAQTLFKCVGRDGKVTYQSEKCADAVRESTVRPPDPVAPKKPPPEPAESPQDVRPAGKPAEPPMEWTTFIAQISSYENCAAIVPGFAGKHKASFEGWKERHRTAFTRYSQDGEAQRRVRESTEYVRGRMNARSPEERQYDTRNCETQVAAKFTPPQAPLNPVPQTPAKSIQTKN